MTDVNKEDVKSLPRITRCPNCGKSTRWDKNEFRPFCSDRCKQIDLGSWALERYRVPGPQAVGLDDNLAPSE